jgi:hypothetical protein
MHYVSQPFDLPPVQTFVPNLLASCCLYRLQSGPYNFEFAEVAKYSVSQNYVNINGLWHHLFPEMCVRDLNGAVARWFLCVEQDGVQVETVL